jgi:hypothetical protein
MIELRAQGFKIAGGNTMHIVAMNGLPLGGTVNIDSARILKVNLI